MGKFYNTVYKLLSGVIKKLYRVEVIGAENEPDEGPFIVAANHLSNHDVVVLAACMKHQVRYIAKAELFKIPLLAQLIKALGAFPVKRGAGDVGAIKTTVALLEEGNVVGFFPQGHRYKGVHPSETEVKPGIGLVAVKAKAKILPVAIYSKKYKMGFFRKTKIIVGKPIDFESHLPLEGNKNDYQRIADTVFADICEMTPKYPALPEGKQ